MQLGAVYDIPPEPFDETRTFFVEAGPVRIGLEHRAIDNTSLEESFSGNADHMERLGALLNGRLVEDQGASLHVCSGIDGHEYLRFDCFDETPHYHYNHKVAPGEPVLNHVILFDRAACGDMFEWALERIRSHLPAMLVQAGAPELAEEIDAPALAKAVSLLRGLASQ